MFSLRGARFEMSVARSQELPSATLREVAFAGRSNAGKSSAINVLADQNRLAFVSKTPGRTQLINFFRCGDAGYLVDLPGYGYAQVPELVRRQWRGLLENYLTRRASLVGLVLIMDARHPLTELDRQMLAWFAPLGRPVHVLLTKSDKLTRSEGALTLSRTRQGLGEYGIPTSVQLFSSLKKTGIEEAEQVIGSWLAACATVDKSPMPDTASPRKPAAAVRHRKSF
jgi:GTP-binding protein